ncbi:hypothetical protein A5765_14310 [Mycolicibacterium celeriflavum]|uniref:DUF7373 family lipoprotein n=1 Tax=Mycolicibacterium celeriflavum TaxID=1249101 RepID=UPI0008014BD4|nr:hypothetical protein [Mycolicibacterium celeriflavum]OBG12527.1 hypothetical protein A5765_14310 [Mycolicibacterium celeriflavum]
MRHAILALISVVALLATACTSTVEGVAVKVTGGPSGPALDFDRLDSGRFPTTPRQPLGVAGDPMLGAVLEGQRLADYVVGPWEVDSALKEGFGFGAVVLPRAESLALIGPMELAGAAARHDFVTGFATVRTEKKRRVLLNAVLRFADDDAAAAAATDLGEAAAQQQGADGPATLEIPGHPEARATSYTASDRTIGSFGAVRSFTAHGPYVFMQQAQATAGIDAAARLVAKSIELQAPVIDEFRATDLSELADISIDPTGLLARTIPLDGRDLTFTKNTTYERRGALHFQSDPVRSAKLFSDTGVDLVAMAGATVYRAEDADGAEGVVEEFFAEVSPTAAPANPVRNMPGSRCLRMTDESFYCLATADRYAIETSAPTLLATQQMTAAQYIMLMSS